MRSTPRLLAPVAALGLAAGIGITAGGSAQAGGLRPAPKPAAPAPAGIDPAARKLIDDMVAAYKSLSSYAGTFEVQVTGQATGPPLRGSVAIQRPARASVASARDAGITRVVTDGIRLHVLLPQSRTPETRTAATGPAAIETALRAGGAMEACLGRLLAGADPLAGRQSTLRSLSITESGVQMGVPVENVVAGWAGPQGEESVVYAIGKEDHLLRLVTSVSRLKEGSVIRTESYADVRANPVLTLATFAISPVLPITPPLPGTVAGPEPTPRTPLPVPSTSSGGSVGAPAPRTPSVGPAPVRYDFGQVSLFDTTHVDHSFAFKNTGSSALKIQRLVGSCGCLTTVATQSGKTLPGGELPTVAPGEEIAIGVTIDLTRLHPGVLQKSVTVFSESSAQPAAVFEISGTLLPAVTFSPSVVNFGQLKAGESRSVVLTASLDMRLGELTALPIVSSNPAVRVRALRDDAAAPKQGKAVVRRYELSLAPDAPLGLLTGSLSFSPSGSPPAAEAAAAPGVLPALRTAVVTVVGQVAGAVSARPQIVAFGLVPGGAPTVREVILTGADEAAVKNLKVSPESSWLSCEVAAVNGEPQGLSRSLKVTLSAEAPVGVIRSQISVTLENGQRLVLPVTAYVREPSAK